MGCRPARANNRLRKSHIFHVDDAANGNWATKHVDGTGKGEVSDGDKHLKTKYDAINFCLIYFAPFVSLQVSFSCRSAALPFLEAGWRSFAISVLMAQRQRWWWLIELSWHRSIALPLRRQGRWIQRRKRWASSLLLEREILFFRVLVINHLYPLANLVASPSLQLRLFCLLFCLRVRPKLCPLISFSHLRPSC